MRLSLLAVGALVSLSVQEAHAGNRSSRSKGWNLQRRYVLTDAGKRSEQEAPLAKFRLLSWNCLAESWTTFNDGNKDMHEDLKWRKRVPRILRELEAKAPHIIVLQELEEFAYHWDVLPKLTSLGYHGIFASSSQTRVGLAILWKTDNFFLSVSMEINLGEPYQSRWYLPMTDRLSVEQQERYLLLSANRVALFAVLVPRGVKQKPQRHALLICAAHLTSIVHHEPIGLDLQVFQATLLMEAIESMVKQQAEKQIKVSVVLAADLNTPSSYPASVADVLSELASGNKLRTFSDAQQVPSPVYELITQGFMREDAIGLVVLALKAGGWQPSAMMFGEFKEMLVADWRSSALASTYSKALGHEVSTCAGQVPEQADYVLFQPGTSSVTSLALMGVLAPPRRMGYREVVRAIGSDHMPLVCDFALLRPGVA